MKFISPCISICKSDPKTGFCYGCARTDEEKKVWKNPETTNSWKKENLSILRKRMVKFFRTQTSLIRFVF